MSPPGTPSHIIPQNAKTFRGAKIKLVSGIFASYLLTNPETKIETASTVRFVNENENTSIRENASARTPVASTIHRSIVEPNSFSLISKCFILAHGSETVRGSSIAI